ncbi:bactofilin family protein [Sphingorhabdus contaminans]|uniref:bactofilin family protein n=1 Tax=Sphingorhabdus contaminans TaxID=1343899 RepID=UPI001FECD75F|nr:polymer-forming cytoskeletal protein [Sphingorhabdus contaminans]
MRNNSGHTFSIIASDVEIVGNLNARVDLHIDGKIQGDVTCGNLVQGEGSIIAGKVIAESARLSGSVEGSIEANDLVIESTARITGDVVYTNLTIAPGGQIEGKFRHKSSGGAPSISRTTVDISKVADPLILGNESKVA